MKDKRGNLFWEKEDPCAALDNIQIGYMDYPASVFLHGVCGFFALALNEKFGYDIVVTAEENTEGLPWTDRIIHVYCRKGNAHIDVRGITKNAALFLEEFSDFTSEHDECFQVQPVDLELILGNAMSREEYNSFYQAAKTLVEKYQEEYQLD